MNQILSNIFSILISISVRSVHLSTYSLKVLLIDAHTFDFFLLSLMSIEYRSENTHLPTSYRISGRDPVKYEDQTEQP